MTTMKSVVYDTYGPPDSLEVRDVEVPQVSDGGVLLRVEATSLNALDAYFLTGTPKFIRLFIGLRTPKRHVPGVDVAGVVERVGGGVTDLSPGDAVFGRCTDGGCSEYVCVPREQLVAKPLNATFEDAAAVGVAAVTALQGLRDYGKLQAGQHVLINGASGGVGTFAVQIAKSFGAEVTAVCNSHNVDVARLLGADHVIDYTKHDLGQLARSGKQQYDVMFDIAGNLSLADCRRLLVGKGIYVSVGGPSGKVLGPIPRLLRTTLLSLVVRQKLLSFTAKSTREDLLILRDMLDDGELTPVIDRTFSLAETVDAMCYLGEGHARGKIIVKP